MRGKAYEVYLSKSGKILNREKITVMDVAMELCVPTDEVIERLSGAKEFSYDDCQIIMQRIFKGRYTWDYIWWCDRNELQWWLLWQSTGDTKLKKKLCPREFRSLTYADKAMIQYLSHQGQTLEYISEVLDIDMDLLAAEYNQYNHNGKYYAK